jgi:hypothetical protein
MTELLTLETFSPLVGDPFRIDLSADPPLGMARHGDEPFELVLERAEPLDAKYQPPNAPRVSFALELIGPANPLLPQRAYTLHHDAAGSFDLFLVPIGPAAHGMRYEAIFN